MTARDFAIRRATTDDLPELIELWRATHLAVEVLEKRFTEFQVVEEQGRLLGAVGLRIAEKQGLIHSETYLDFSDADRLRPQLWERVLSMTRNHGLVRLWTLETAPFWKQNGLKSADAEEFKKLPADFGSADSKWLTLKLREEVQVEKELSALMESEKQRTQKVLENARMLKGFAYFLAIALFIVVMAIVAFLLLRQRTPGLVAP